MTGRPPGQLPQPAGEQPSLRPARHRPLRPLSPSPSGPARTCGTVGSPMRD